MQELSDVKLHVWRLEPPSSNFFTRLLPSMGFCPYHTSLEVFNTRYSFSPSGILQTSSQREGVPPNAQYEGEIDLGACAVSKGELNQIIKRLRNDKLFGAQKYHLVPWNCNSFTEVLATAIILYDELRSGENVKRLKTYPEKINRLANTSKMVVNTGGDDIVSCNVIEEAKIAVGAEVGATPETNTNKSAAYKQKKELTEAQKKALTKLKSKK